MPAKAGSTTVRLLGFALRMRFLTFRDLTGTQGLAIAEADGTLRGLASGPERPVPTLSELLARPETLAAAYSRLRSAPPLDPTAIQILPPLPSPGKILCIGLNYRDHAAESGTNPPSSPPLFLRSATSLVGHGSPLLLPSGSDQLDFEGELVAVIGRSGRRIPASRALDHVIGYSVFNDGSVRDFQFRSSQWTLGKNFDRTGGFGPWLVTADELPPGGAGLRLETRLNGQPMQRARTEQMVFPVAELVALLSEAMTLQPGDLLVTGTPAGVGFARKPPVFLRAGDLCEVEIEGIGVLRNPVSAAEG